MAHYAFLDSNNIVTHVITGCDEDGSHDWEAFYAAAVGQRCKRTSFNTRGNKHISGGVPFRGNYAGAGYTYDEARDAFIPPQPYPSWTLNEQSCVWDAPKPFPSEEGVWYWDEQAGDWMQPQTPQTP